MDSDSYLISILQKHSANNDFFHLAKITKAHTAMGMIITEWAGSQLNEIKLSGSTAKGTAIAKSADLDLFISLKSNTPQSLEDLYTSLNTWLSGKGYKTRLQNVSIGIEHEGVKVDLAPAKLHPNQGLLLLQDHWLYVRKGTGQRIKTNIDKQIKHIKDANRTNEIRLIKIWRDLHNLEFPSVYLELSVINALGNSGLGMFLQQTTLTERILKIFRYLSSNFETTTIYDTGNPSNEISKELTSAEKKAISLEASRALQSQHWSQVVW